MFCFCVCFRDSGQFDIYDARFLGGLPAPSAVPECEGESCQLPGSASEYPTPASLLYVGPGNSKPKPPKKCPKGTHKVKRKGKGKCVKKHKKGASSKKKHRRGTR